MKPASREQDVFAEALQHLSPETRAAYLDGACGADAVLRRRVEALLHAAESAGEFLEQPPTGLVVGDGSTWLVTGFNEKPGDRIGRYKLLEQIGEGGCGVVYMAEQEEPVRRRVALKVIKLGMDTKSVIARFEAERQALALMDHPNIAKVLDAGATATGRPFFVMELVRGVRITDYCDENTLSTKDRLKLFIQVCQAIQHAHQKGVIHRDIKPSNILVADHDGVPVPKVIDFGIAKATTDQRLTDKTLFTAFEQFLGTPAYMSPEQAKLSGLDIDTRSDIYSLGVLLYELLTGKTPFDARELLQAGLDEMRRTICEKDPARPSARLSTMRNADLTEIAKHRRSEPPKLLSLVRGDLDWIVMKALEKDRARRYETANGLATDVQRHLESEPVTARPPGKLYWMQKLVRRNQLAFAAAAIVAVTILLAVVLLVASNVRTIQERNQKDLALRAKGAALDVAYSSEKRAKEELFASLENQAQARRYSRQMGQKLETLAVVTEAARIRVDGRLRNEAIAAMALPDLRRGPSWHVWRTNFLALACDATGQRYAALDYEGKVTVRSIPDNREIQRFETKPAGVDLYTDLSFSPDGMFLAKVGDGQQPLVWCLNSGKAILQDAPEGACAPAFSANHRFVALARGEEVFCFDLATGREMNHWKTAGRVHTLQFHPADNRVAVGYKDWPWVSVYDATNGRELAQLKVGEGRHMLVSWHPDGRQLAVGGTALGIQIWDVEAQRQLARLEGQAPQVDFLTFHPSGKWLASWSWDGAMCLWDPTTGRQAMQIPLVVGNLQFSRDGQWLGFFWPSEERAQLLEFVSPQGYFTLVNNSGVNPIAQHLCAATDDRFLAVAMVDGVHLWNLQADREVALAPAALAETVMFGPGGKELWTCDTSNALQRWTIHPEATNNLEQLLGPPVRIELPFVPLRFAVDRAGHTLAVVSQNEGQVMVLDLAKKSTRSLPVRDPMVDFIALSPDAKWLATSGWHSDRAQLWNLESGKLAKDWVVGLETRVAFTPDSSELIVERGSEFQFLKVETLEISRRLKREMGLYPGNVAFSPDGKLMAMEMTPAVIHLKEVSSGRTVAELEDPFGDRSNMILFTHDGTKLIVLSTYTAAIHFWDLHAIRAGLKPLGLDWDWPEFSAQTIASAMPNSRQPVTQLPARSETATVRSPATISTPTPP
ncbi:MAG TPA: serine/threonine-protein kinase [Verrucomicrobiae bacterium]|nr:serine/threonine-protein kinase [Verrucomicrobiae bacterium]